VTDSFSNEAMAAKLEIATTTHSTDEVAIIVSDFISTSVPLRKQTQLFGGYSGSNYRVDLADGSTFVLKITNGYSAEHAELMCRTVYYLGETGYKDCCLPIPKRDKATFRFVSTKEHMQVPAVLMTYADGRQADRVMREQPHLATTVMRGIGGGLARMHNAVTGISQEQAETLGIRWYATDGGCCDVQNQVDGAVLATILDCKEVLDHDFVQNFYQSEFSALQNEMQLAKEGKLMHGITHGDPFADNVRVNSETGELSAFIDVEDVCVGPLLFDLACCAIGCCFKEASAQDGKRRQILDMPVLEALLKGYCADRKLPQIEKDHFVPFMRLTLLCNCCWRFVKFNIQTRDVPEEARNSYLELQWRIEYLRDPDIVRGINKLLEEHV
jgi:Ser/Thr protein kinase RdoA (MazF antagonist)